MSMSDMARQAALRAQAAFEKTIFPDGKPESATNVTVSVCVPVSEIDVSRCDVQRYYVPQGDELGGRESSGEYAYEVDIYGARYNGLIIDTDFLTDADRDRIEGLCIEEVER